MPELVARQQITSYDLIQSNYTVQYSTAKSLAKFSVPRGLEITKSNMCLPRNALRNVTLIAKRSRKVNCADSPLCNTLVLEERMHN